MKYNSINKTKFCNIFDYFSNIKSYTGNTGITYNTIEINSKQLDKTKFQNTDKNISIGLNIETNTQNIMPPDLNISGVEWISKTRDCFAVNIEITNNMNENNRENRVENMFMGLSIESNRYETRFQELDIIGIGGFGKVYKVSDKFDKQEYAIKVISLKGINNYY